MDDTEDDGSSQRGVARSAHHVAAPRSRGQRILTSVFSREAEDLDADLRKRQLAQLLHWARLSGVSGVPFVVRRRR